jgi:hypothetical protein
MISREHAGASDHEPRRPGRQLCVIKRQDHVLCSSATRATRWRWALRPNAGGVSQRIVTTLRPPAAVGASEMAMACLTHLAGRLCRETHTASPKLFGGGDLLSVDP